MEFSHDKISDSQAGPAVAIQVGAHERRDRHCFAFGNIGEDLFEQLSPIGAIGEIATALSMVSRCFTMAARAPHLTSKG